MPPFRAVRAAGIAPVPRMGSFRLGRPVTVSRTPVWSLLQLVC